MLLFKQWQREKENNSLLGRVITVIMSDFPNLCPLQKVLLIPSQLHIYIFLFFFLSCRDIFETMFGGGPGRGGMGGMGGMGGGTVGGGGGCAGSGGGGGGGGMAF